ncbi:MAG: IMP dehydrogenase, partial [Pseudomonadota bacterium]
MIRRAYTFDEVALVPQFNNIPSRTEPSLDTWLTRNRKVSMPLVPANMDSVVSEDLAEVIIGNGSAPIYHRFTDFEQQKEWVRRFEDKTFVSCGMRDIDDVRTLLDLGAAGVCIDIAHGHSDRMMNYVEDLKRTHPNQDVIAGNVCTAMAYHDLVNAGADAVKVG